MTEHGAALLAFVLAAVCLLAASGVGGLHLSPRVTSPLGAAATVAISTVLVLLTSIFVVWGLLHLGYTHAH